MQEGVTKLILIMNVNNVVRNRDVTINKVDILV